MIEQKAVNKQSFARIFNLQNVSCDLLTVLYNKVYGSSTTLSMYSTNLPVLCIYITTLHVKIEENKVYT